MTQPQRPPILGAKSSVKPVADVQAKEIPALFKPHPWGLDMAGQSFDSQGVAQAEEAGKSGV